MVDLVRGNIAFIHLEILGSNWYIINKHIKQHSKRRQISIPSGLIGNNVDFTIMLTYIQHIMQISSKSNNAFPMMSLTDRQIHRWTNGRGRKRDKPITNQPTRMKIHPSPSLWCELDLSRASMMNLFNAFQLANIHEGIDDLLSNNFICFYPVGWFKIDTSLFWVYNNYIYFLDHSICSFSAMTGQWIISLDLKT